jgi:hypothetical protein
VLLACAGCRREAGRAEAGLADRQRAAAGDPGEPVHAYFAALETSDCAKLEASVAGEAGASLAEHGCEQVFADFAEHPTRLLRIESVTPDGRDSDVRLVRAKLRVGGREQEVVVGVRAVDGRWRVVRI